MIPHSSFSSPLSSCHNHHKWQLANTKYHSTNQKLTKDIKNTNPYSKVTAEYTQKSAHYATKVLSSNKRQKAITPLGHVLLC